MRLMLLASLLLPVLAFAAEPFDLKGDQLGMPLADYIARHARIVQGHNEQAPWCSTSRPHQSIAPLMSEPWFDAADIVTCRTNFPFEEYHPVGPESRPTVAGAIASLLIYHFVDGKLYEITIEISHDDYAAVRGLRREIQRTDERGDHERAESPGRHVSGEDVGLEQ